MTNTKPWHVPNFEISGDGTSGVRDCSHHYTMFCAQREMHTKFATVSTDRAAVATTPVRLEKQGHVHMRVGVLFCLAPRWMSNSAHRPNTCRYDL